MKKSLIYIAIMILGLLFALPAVDASGKDQKGSTLGGVPLEGLDDEEAKDLLQTELKNWQNAGAFYLTSKYERFEVPKTAFKFDLDASLEDYRDSTKRSWETLFLKPKNVHVPLAVKLDERSLNLPAYIDRKKTAENARHAAEELKGSTAAIKYIDSPETMLQPIASVELKLTSGMNAAAIQHLAGQLNEKMIKPDSTFSLIENSRLPKELKGRSEEFNMLATGLYELALHTNMKIAEKHSQDDMPEYAKDGLSAAVDPDKEKDFVLVNQNAQSYQINAALEHDTLQMSLLSFPQTEKFNYELQNETTLEPRTVYRYDSSLPPGSEQMTDTGEPGLKFDVYRVHTGADGSVAEKQLVETAAYLPKPKIILTSAQEMVTTDPETDSNNGIDEDDNLTTPDTGTTNDQDTDSGTAQQPDMQQSPGNQTVPNQDNQEKSQTQPGTDADNAQQPEQTPSKTAPQTQKPAKQIPNLESVKPELKKALEESLIESCMKTKKENDKVTDADLRDRCKKESESVSDWLLEFLLQDNVWNTKSGSAQDGKGTNGSLASRNPELNGILEGMK